MRCQTKLNYENEMRFRSGGERDVEQLSISDRIYHLVSGSQGIFVNLMGYKY